MKRTVKELLLKDFNLDGYTVGAAVDLLNNFNRDAKIEFLTRWEYDTCFEIELVREQTDEEYASELAKKQAEETAEKVREYEAYLKLKAIYDKLDENV
jgi:hypothetical protein